MNVIEMEKSSRTPKRRGTALYRGTDTEDANRIEREGIKPEKDGHGWKEGHTYFTPSKEVARAYADVYSDIAHDPKSKTPRDKGAILMYQPRPSKIEEAKRNMADSDTGFRETTISGDIPPHRIKKVS